MESRPQVKPTRDVLHNLELRCVNLETTDSNLTLVNISLFDQKCIEKTFATVYNNCFDQWPVINQWQVSYWLIQIKRTHASLLTKQTRKQNNENLPPRECPAINTGTKMPIPAALRSDRARSIAVVSSKGFGVSLLYPEVIPIHSCRGEEACMASANGLYRPPEISAPGMIIRQA